MGTRHEMSKKGADAAVRKIGKFGLVFLALAALLLVLTAACGGGEEEKTTPTATRTAAATASRTATPAASGTAVATATATTAAATPTAEPTATAPTTAPTAEVTATLAETPSLLPFVHGITDEKIVLGSHFAQTGIDGPFNPVLWGMKAYFEYVNTEKGGVCGRQIILKAEDDGSDPAKAIEVVRKLVEQDEVYAIVAGLGTAVHSAVWDYLNEKGIPDLWIMSGAHKWAADPAAHPWSVAILPDYYVEGTIFGKYISRSMPGRKVGVLYQNTDFGQDEMAGVKNGLDPAKNELVSEQSFEPTAVDIRSQVTNLKDAGVEVVVGACIPGHCAQAIKAAYQMNWDVQWFISSVNAEPEMFQYAGGAEVMEGVITLQGNKMYDWTDDPAIAEHDRIMKEYGPDNLTIEGQLAAELTVEALSRTCNKLTRQGLMDAVHSFQDYQSDLMLPGITITLSPTDHLATESFRMLKATVVEGKGKWEYFGDLISLRD